MLTQRHLIEFPGRCSRDRIEGHIFMIVVPALVVGIYELVNGIPVTENASVSDGQRTDRAD